MDRWVGKIAVITGAAGGIGGAVYRALAENGVLVVGLDKNLKELEDLILSVEETQKSKVYTRQCDVSNEEDIVNAFEWIKDEFGGIDILVNSAGISRYGRIIESNGDSFRNLMSVNVIATAIATREAVASMKNRDAAGHIVNINSVLGHSVDFSIAIPSNLYSPSKFAITAMTDIVRKELNEISDKIKITSLSPGSTKTGLAEAAGIPNAGNIFEFAPHLQPKDIADAILYVLGTPPNVQVTELTIRSLHEA